MQMQHLQRVRSLNAVKPLPTPDSMKSLRKGDSTNNFSSRSSIATDYSLQVTTLPSSS